MEALLELGGSREGTAELAGDGCEAGGRAEEGVAVAVAGEARLEKLKPWLLSSDDTFPSLIMSSRWPNVESVRFQLQTASIGTH